jgi:hypothetical protein
MPTLSSTLGTWNGGGSGGGSPNGKYPGDTMYVLNHYDQTLGTSVVTLLGGVNTVAILDNGFGLVNMTNTSPGVVKATTSPDAYIDIGVTNDMLWWSPINDSNLQGVRFPDTTTITCDNSRGVSYTGIAITGNATLSNQTVQFTIVNNVITSINLQTPL